jgi:hypothetical protein
MMEGGKKRMRNKIFIRFEKNVEMKNDFYIQFNTKDSSRKNNNLIMISLRVEKSKMYILNSPRVLN